MAEEFLTLMADLDAARRMTAIKRIKNQVKEIIPAM